MQTLTPKHDRMLTIFLLLGLMILAFILTPLMSMVCGQRFCGCKIHLLIDSLRF